MTHPRFRVLVVLAAVLVTPVVVATEPLTLTLDPAKCRAGFTLDSTLHTVHGTIPVSAGAISFDSAGGPASGEVRLDATRAESGNDGRDEKMHDEVLETARFPTIVFTASEVRGALPEDGEGTLTLVGTIDLHGDRHPFEIPSVLRRQGDRVTATGSASIPYVAWGLKDPSVFILRADKEVAVKLEVEGILSR